MIKLIVGLGNPGPTYEKTRHNAGFWFVERLAHEYQSSFKTEKAFHGHVASIKIGQHTCHLLSPSTFMNHSGRSVQALARFYQYQPEEILVAHDELDIPIGTCRLKMDGGHGGHNGLRDIIQCLGSAHFARLRIGIGRPVGNPLNYVLGLPSKGEKENIDNAMDKASTLLPEITTGSLQKAMTLLHTQPLLGE